MRGLVVFVVVSCLLVQIAAHEKEETCEKKGCPERNGKVFECVRVLFKDGRKKEFVCIPKHLIQKAEKTEQKSEEAKANEEKKLKKHTCETKGCPKKDEKCVHVAGTREHFCLPNVLINWLARDHHTTRAKRCLHIFLHHGYWHGHYYC